MHKHIMVSSWKTFLKWYLTWIRDDLPVQPKRRTFDKAGDEAGQKGCSEGGPVDFEDEMQIQALEELLYDAHDDAFL